VIIKEGDTDYAHAPRTVLESEKQFKEEQKSKLEQEISGLSSKLS